MPSFSVPGRGTPARRSRRASCRPTAPAGLPPAEFTDRPPLEDQHARPARPAAPPTCRPRHPSRPRCSRASPRRPRRGAAHQPGQAHAGERGLHELAAVQRRQGHPVRSARGSLGVGEHDARLAAAPSTSTVMEAPSATSRAAAAEPGAPAPATSSALRLVEQVWPGLAALALHVGDALDAHHELAMVVGVLRRRPFSTRPTTCDQFSTTCISASPPSSTRGASSPAWPSSWAGSSSSVWPSSPAWSSVGFFVLRVFVAFPRRRLRRRRRDVQRTRHGDLGLDRGARLDNRGQRHAGLEAAVGQRVRHRGRGEVGVVRRARETDRRRRRDWRRRLRCDAAVGLEQLDEAGGSRRRCRRSISSTW